MESKPKQLLHKILSEGKKGIAPLLARLSKTGLNTKAPLLLLIVGPLPLLFLCFHFSSKQQKIKQTENKISLLERKFSLANIQKEKENTFLKTLKKASPDYLDRNIETLSFLETETHKLKEKQNNQARLNFLQAANRIRFTEENIKRSGGVQETEERQERPVEMNEEDLKKTLALIEEWEETPEGKPQLIISSFRLKKKGISPYEHVYEVSMDLVKREAIR